MHLSTVKGVGPVVRQGAEARALRNTASVYELAATAINAGHSLADPDRTMTTGRCAGMRT